MGKKRGNSCRENEEISWWKAHINILYWNILTITDTFLDQKRVNLCEHTLSWLRKTSVIVEMFQLSFRMFMCGFHQEISLFFGKSFFLPFLLLCYLYFGIFLSMWVRLRIMLTDWEAWEIWDNWISYILKASAQFLQCKITIHQLT